MDGDEEMAEEAEWKDDGSMPLNKEGGLPFYFLDAHEEANAPHTVYLFGKVCPLMVRVSENEQALGISGSNCI